MDQLRARVTSLEGRVEAIEVSTRTFAQQMAENTKITRRIETLTADNNDLLVAIRSGIKVFGWLGAFLKWGAGIVAALATAWVAFKGFGR